MADKKNQQIVVIHVEPPEGFHGGNWKIVYADFVTAMMAFFLLMWILSSVERETLEGVSNYFEVTEYTEPQLSGSGNIFNGVNFNESGRLEIDQHTAALDLEYSNKRFTQSPVKKKGLEDQTRNGEAHTVDLESVNLFRSIKEKIEAAIEALDQELSIFKSTVKVTAIDDGLLISIVDKPESRFFYPESALLTPEARQLMAFISSQILDKELGIILAGVNNPNTDKTANLGLSITRANSVRQTMERIGIKRNRFERILGLVDSNDIKSSVLSELLDLKEFVSGGENIKIAIQNKLYKDKLGRDIEAPSLFKSHRNTTINTGPSWASEVNGNQ